MMGFLAKYWGTILVAAIVAALIILVVVKMIKDKKSGKTSCGCGCKNCPSSGMCHKK